MLARAQSLEQRHGRRALIELGSVQGQQQHRLVGGAPALVHEARRRHGTVELAARQQQLEHLAAQVGIARRGRQRVLQIVGRLPQVACLQGGTSGQIVAGGIADVADLRRRFRGLPEADAPPAAGFARRSRRATAPPRRQRVNERASGRRGDGCNGALNPVRPRRGA